MRIEKEVIHGPQNGGDRLFSSKVTEMEPFKSAKVKQGGYGVFGDDFWLKRTSNRGFHVFVLTLSGSGIIVFDDGTEFRTVPGQVFISSASGQGHFEKASESTRWEMVWLTFWDDSPFFIPATEDYDFKNIQDPESISAPFSGILREETAQDSRSDEALELYERLFLINLGRALELSGNSNLSKHRIELSKLWEKVAGTLSCDWSLQDLASEIGYSRSHLSRICIELYDRNPGDIVKEFRMKQAKALLLNSVESVETIAGRVGYPRLSTFSNAFHEYYGISPREFRKANCQPGILKYINA